MSFFVGVTEGPAVPIFVVRRELAFTDADVDVTCVIRNLPLPKGRYYLWLGLQKFDDFNWAKGYGHRIQRQGGAPLPWQSVKTFEAIVRPVPVHVDASWSVEESDAAAQIDAEFELDGRARLSAEGRRVGGSAG
jgi:hypothetical protein